MKNRSYIVLWLMLLSLSSPVFSDDSCEYRWDIDRCYQANGNGSQRSIEDFSCPTSSDIETIAYQVILDKKFQEVDKKVEAYLDKIETDKDTFFWKSKQGNSLDGVNEVTAVLGKNGDFYKEYMGLCWIDLSYDTPTILYETLICLEKTTITWAQWYLWQSKGNCAKLVEIKTKINTQVAYNVLSLNKAQIKKDEKKIYMQASRTKYNDLLDIMNINIGYIERIWMKLPKKLKKALI